jgi:uncharacterized PurR-regulated membrane protein YhhQ (DUF165 family)
MTTEVLILIAEALVVYFVVLWAHSLRHHFGPVHFYALIGGLTAVMSWVTDAGMAVEAMGITFYVGSTVFYTSLLLGVFVIYVFDGPQVTRVMIFTIVGVSALVPVIAMILHLQSALISDVPLDHVPLPSLRMNAASVVTTLVDLVFLAIVWEALRRHNRVVSFGMRTFLTLLGVMWLDVVLFSTLAFAGTPGYLSIMSGTLLARFLVTVLAFPMLFLYVQFQRKRPDVEVENRPVLAILKKITEVEQELSRAEEEIRRRKQAEEELQKALSEVKTLQGLIPVCAGCKKIRDDEGYWQQMETYLSHQTDVRFSHGVCPDCMEKYYPDVSPPPHSSPGSGI